jgi:hypothetical protein
MTPASNAIEHARGQAFGTMGSFVESDLPNGRFSVRLDSGRFECLLKRKPGSHLFVMLSSGLEGAEDSPPRFERLDWEVDLPGSLLCVSDPGLHLDPPRLRVAWYLGTDQHDWPLRLAGLVRSIAKKLGVPTRRIVCCGSKSGGFAALMLAAQLKDSTALSIDPDLDVTQCDSEALGAILRTCFSGKPLDRLMPQHRMRFSAAEAFAAAPAARCLIIADSGASAPYQAQIEPFLRALNVPLWGGASPCGRIVYRPRMEPSGNSGKAETGATRRALIAAAIALPSHAMPSPDPAVRSEVPAAQSANRPASDTAARIRASQLYLIRNRRQACNQQSIDFQPRADRPALAIALPLDWNQDPFSDRNWCAQLHMWRMMENHLLEFDSTGDAQWLTLPIAIIDDWNDFHLVHRRRSAFAWKDMMVGMRAMKIAFVLSAHQAGAVTLGADRLKAYDRLVERHLAFLLDPSNVAYTNHTLIDMHGLAAVREVVPAPRRAQIDAFLQQVMPRLLQGQFDDNGVHRENSPGYQSFGIGCVKRLAKSHWFGRFGVDELMRRAELARALFSMPDGRCVPIGDTDGAAMTEQRVCSFKAERELTNRSGYVVWRDDGAGHADNASYLFFMAAFHSPTHKHCDDLSFVWFEGEDILCDTGKYGYNLDGWREYAISSRAHNTIEVDGKNIYGSLAGRPELVYGSAVTQAVTTEWGCIISGAVTHPACGVIHTRHLLYGDKQWLLVIDRIDGSHPHNFAQWFHFAPHLELDRASDQRFTAAMKNGRRLSVMSTATDRIGVMFARGQLEPVRQGWVSQSYGTMVPNVALAFTQRSKSALFATLFSVDDCGSAISIAGASVLKAQIRTRLGDVALDIALVGDRCVATKEPGSPDAA